jgi:hypothetical protein
MSAIVKVGTDVPEPRNPTYPLDKLQRWGESYLTHLHEDASFDQIEFADALEDVLFTIWDTLIKKNSQYGNSALDPVRIFSRGSTTEQIKVRIDDKLSRIQRRPVDETEDEDTVLDLMGYLALLRIAQKRGENKVSEKR